MRHGQALRLGDGQPRRRPRGADLRRPRLYARERRRALLPRAARRPHLGRHQRDPAPDHRQRPLQARPASAGGVTSALHFLSPLPSPPFPFLSSPAPLKGAGRGGGWTSDSISRNGALAPPSLTLPRKGGGDFF